jgi:hypothetical protein
MRQINDGQCISEKKHSPLRPPSASSPLILQSPVRPHPAVHVTLHHVLDFASTSTEPLKQENRLIPSSYPPSHAWHKIPSRITSSTHARASALPRTPRTSPAHQTNAEKSPPARPHPPEPKKTTTRIGQPRTQNLRQPPGRKIVRFFEDHAARRA